MRAQGIQPHQHWQDHRLVHAGTEEGQDHTFPPGMPLESAGSLLSNAQRCWPPSCRKPGWVPRVFMLLWPQWDSPQAWGCAEELGNWLRPEWGSRGPSLPKQTAQASNRGSPQVLATPVD